MAQKMAVDWLIEFIQDHCIRIDEKVIERAKAMEKQQIMDAYHDGAKSVLEKNINTMQNYYNETFGA